MTNDMQTLLNGLRANVFGDVVDGWQLCDNQQLYGFKVRQIKGLYSALAKAGLYQESFGVGKVKVELGEASEE